MRNSSSRTAVKAANRLLVTPPRRSFATLRMTSEGSRQTLGCARGTEMLRCAQDDSPGQRSSNVTLSPCAALRVNSAKGPLTGSLLSKCL